MLLNTDPEGSNAWQIAAFRDELVKVEEICEWAKERLTKEEIKNEMLLRTDGEGKNV